MSADKVEVRFVLVRLAHTRTIQSNHITNMLRVLCSPYRRSAGRSASPLLLD